MHLNTKFYLIGGVALVLVAGGVFAFKNIPGQPIEAPSNKLVSSGLSLVRSGWKVLNDGLDSIPSVDNSQGTQQNTQIKNSQSSIPRNTQQGSRQAIQQQDALEVMANNIQNQMKKNSAQWWVASSTQKTKLHEANEILADQLGTVMQGTIKYDAKAGTWNENAGIAGSRSTYTTIYSSQKPTKQYNPNP
jgi:hypothetical protein